MGLNEGNYRLDIARCHVRGILNESARRNQRIWLVLGVEWQTLLNLVRAIPIIRTLGIQPSLCVSYTYMYILNFPTIPSSRK